MPSRSLRHPGPAIGRFRDRSPQAASPMCYTAGIVIVISGGAVSRGTNG